MDEYDESVITSRKDVKGFSFGPDPSTVSVIDISENIDGGVETGSTGERDMHSDATSPKHAAPTAPEDDVPKQDDRSSSASNVNMRTDKNSHGGLYETESSNSASQTEATGHASDFQSAEGLASDMPDRKGIHTPASSGDRATDITGIPYIQ
jgi:hypothetical protein